MSERDAAAALPALPRHLYVHVPLCRSKCAYCDFYSTIPDTLPLSAPQIVDALVSQTKAWAERGLAVAGVDTIYVGGGTPTMLGTGLADLVSAIAIWAEAEMDAEITVEANPESTDAALLELLAMAGVTRVSVGIQSLNDAELALLGRAHDARQAREVAAQVKQAGLALSVDLMCGLPAQTRESWRTTLRGITALEPDHVSVYPLTLEPDTALADDIESGALPEPDPDLAAQMLEDAADVLCGAGLGRYEVANYARPGCASRHNTAYWTGASYLGIGPGAHGMLDAVTARAAGLLVPEQTARVRYAVATNPLTGFGFMPQVDVELLDAAAAAREDAMLGMRMSAGIADELAERAGVVSIMERLWADGLVEHYGDRWTPTTRGWLLGNEVFGRLWVGE